jgi:protein-S-isoprenylcysteine O-methyltransferase Ste14
MSPGSPPSSAPVAFRANVFDEKGSASLKRGDAPPKFKFAPTFVIDLAFTCAYLLLVMPAWAAASHTRAPILPTFLIAVLLAGCYVGKIFVVRHLDRKGGDARAYVESDSLVTDGPFAWSRHPTYTLAFAQFLLWSALALYLQAFEPWRPLLVVAAFALPALFFVLNDRIVMPSEEAKLAELHPAQWTDYCARVNRWFGRRAA